MNNNWMIDVLRDMRHVAQRSAMMDLAESLDDVIFVAACELRNREAAPAALGGYELETRNLSGTAPRHGDRA